MNSFFRSLILIIFFAVSTQAQTKITIELKNYDNDTLILGNYFGEKTLVKDTILAKSKGRFVYQPKDTVALGVYLVLLKPSNDFFQYLVNGIDKEVTVYANAKVLDEVDVKGSPENKAFYDYMKFLKTIRPEADTLKAQLDRAKKAELPTTKEEKALEDLDKKVQKEQNDIIAKYPGSVLALLLKANIEPVIPEFEGSDEEKQRKRYFYYKSRYFDNIDFFHPAILRTPFLYQKVNYYLTKLTPQSPDSIIIAVDYILKKVEHNPEMYRYFLADLLNKYAQLKIVGHDALYVHLVDKYYTKGKAHWVDEETLDKMKENANDLRPILIGKKMPDFVTFKEDKSPVKLYNIQSLYTILFFWAPDCGHCKKITPNVVDFYKKYKDKGVKLISICTKSGDKYDTCWPAIKEKGMEDFINTGDEFRRYDAIFKIKTTPKIFILDKDKKILLKDIPAEDIEKIFEEVMRVEEMRKAEKQ
ncbi:MAG: redoxin domain-containing protein [Saprospiraceae bacterium]|nr:redoxin domain-containing protein [Saprospiraceae bacterium]